MNPVDPPDPTDVSGPAPVAAGLLLAAGAGSRMGMPKALVHDERGSWLRRGVEVLRQGGCDPVVVVLGAAAEAADLLDGSVRVVVAQDWADGMGASLRTGLAAVDGPGEDTESVVVSLVDLPDLVPAVVSRVVDRAGGAGAAVAWALKDLGVQETLIMDQKTDLAQDLAAQIGGNCHAVTEFIAAQGVTGIVNATPMGMASHPGSAIAANVLDARQWVADIVYFPLETQLLRDARAAGCQTISGAGMAVHQAALSFGYFTGLQADAARMRTTFEAF